MFLEIQTPISLWTEHSWSCDHTQLITEQTSKHYFISFQEVIPMNTQLIMRTQISQFGRRMATSVWPGHRFEADRWSAPRKHGYDGGDQRGIFSQGRDVHDPAGEHDDDAAPVASVRPHRLPVWRGLGNCLCDVFHIWNSVYIFW